MVKDKTKILIYGLNALLFITICFGNAFYILEDSILVKSITSLNFVLIGIINVIYVLVIEKNYNLKHILIMLAGLIFAMAGDIVLEYVFILGAALFAIGHVLFFVAYCFVEKFKWIDLIPGAIIFIPATLFILLAPVFNFESVLMQIVCVVYAIIISLMLGKSISNFIRNRSVLNIIILIGSFLFLFSDLMLLLRHFAGLSNIFGILCLATYYPAEALLAFSILFSKNKSSKEKISIKKKSVDKVKI